MKNMEIKIELNEEYAAEYGKGKAEAKESNVVPFPTSSDAAAADQIEVVDAETLTDPKNVVQRDEYIERIDVLTKVGGLLLLEGTELATARQLAEYYEVNIEAIRKIVTRHRSELESDGMINKTYSEIQKVLGHDVSILSSGVSYRGANVFPKRAILRIGMLLRDSEIAREVRSQLLNIEEAATNEQRTAAIDQEDALLLAMIKAKDPITSAAAIAEYSEFQNARIKKAEEVAEKYEGKANKFDQLIDQSNLLTMTNVGKSYLGGVSAQELNRFLIDRGILYKKQIDGVRLYRKGYEKYFRVVTYDIGHRTLKVTIDGALFIADLYKKSIK
jgi:phage antirepressor YoqD-like protein